MCPNNILHIKENALRHICIMQKLHKEIENFIQSFMKIYNENPGNHLRDACYYNT